MTTINELWIKPSLNDHASKVICTADHITQKEPMKTEITLEYVGTFCVTLSITQILVWNLIIGLYFWNPRIFIVNKMF